jgi:hypothetical protein
MRIPVLLIGTCLVLSSVAWAEDTATAATRTWQIRIGDVPTPFHQDESLPLELSFSGPALTGPVKLTYLSEMLLRGDTLYEGTQKYVGVVNSETRKVLAAQADITFGPENRAALAVPLAGHPFGLFYMTLELLDADGRSLHRQQLTYEVVVPTPKGTGRNLAGQDGWGWAYAWYGIDAPENRPGKWASEGLRRRGFAWVHMRAEDGLMKEFSGKELDERLGLLGLWVDAARQADCRIIMCIANHMPNQTPERFRDFAAELLRRFGKDVAVWDVWNEPDSKPWVLKDDFDIEAIRITHALAQTYCPTAAVITSTHTTSGMNYTKRIFEKGAGKYMSGMGLHSYRSLAPDVPEPDSYVGNPSGMATLLDSFGQCRELLRRYHVSPPDIYQTEANYALNLIPQYDDNDQANFMIRCNILSWTTPDVKCYCHHAFGNGRLSPPAYPNLVAHLARTTFRRRLDAGDQEVHAYLFRRDDGTLILPLWTVAAERMVTLSGLKAKPALTDLFGNPLEVSYDAKTHEARYLRLSQAPCYLTVVQRRAPQLAVSRSLALAAADRTVRGQPLDLTVTCQPPVRPALLRVHFPPAWHCADVEQQVTQDARLEQRAEIGAAVEPGRYLVEATLADPQGRVVALANRMVRVTLPQGELLRKYGVVLADDFEGADLADWNIQHSSQSETRIVTEAGNRILLITQAGVDYPAMLERPLPAVRYGVLEFDLRPSAVRQTFEVRCGSLILQYDGAGEMGLLDPTGQVARIGSLPPDQWGHLRVFFSAPDGRCRAWVGERYAGEFAVPASPDGYGSLRLMSGVRQTATPAVFGMDALRVTQIEPQELGRHRPLRWTVCGPFPNRVDPRTEKRPFDLGTDYLAGLGGEANLYPYPGLAVAAGAEPRIFTTFYESEQRGAQGDYVAFANVKELGLNPDHGDILCYAAAYLISPEEKTVNIGIGSDDSFCMWVNGKEVGRVSAWPTGRGMSAFSERYEVPLRKGLNVIHLKVDQGFGGYEFCLEIK